MKGFSIRTISFNLLTLKAFFFSLAITYTSMTLAYAQAISGGGHQWEELPAAGQNEMKYYIQTDNIKIDNNNADWRHAVMLMHPVRQDTKSPYQSMTVEFTIDCPIRTRRTDTATIYDKTFAQGKVVQTQKGYEVFETIDSETDNAFVARVCK